MTFYIIIRGPLGIGKSTISKELAKKLKAEYISIDKILEDNALDKVDEKLGSIPVENFIKTNNIILPKIKSYLESGKPVILDGCFYFMEQIKHLRDNLPFMTYAFNLKAPLSTCINRDKGREKVYGKEAASAVYKLVSKFDYGVNLNTEGKTFKECVKEILDYIKAYEKAHSFNKYNPKITKLFDKEKLLLTKVLGKSAIIEHVGSTAVSGLGGKGILDIAIWTPKDKLEQYMSKLKKLGFEERPNHAADDRRVFMLRVIKENGKEHRIHIHLCLTKEFWDSFIAFRDYLRNHKDARDEYQRIKKEGSKHAQGDGKKYADYKGDFIKETMKKALDEQTQIYPKNKAHFLKLVEFAKNISEICKSIKVEPILYGNACVFMHTRDPNLEVNDFDFLISENSFIPLIKELKKRKIRTKFNKKWHVLQIFSGNLKIEVDSKDFWQKDLPNDFVQFNMAGLDVKAVSLRSLTKIYKHASDVSKDNPEGNRIKYEMLRKLK